MPRYGCLICQAEELTLMVSHSFIYLVKVKFFLPVGAVGLGTRELSWDLVRLRACDSRHIREAAVYTGSREAV